MYLPWQSQHRRCVRMSYVHIPSGASTNGSASIAEFRKTSKRFGGFAECVCVWLSFRVLFASFNAFFRSVLRESKKRQMGKE